MDKKHIIMELLSRRNKQRKLLPNNRQLPSNKRRKAFILTLALLLFLPLLLQGGCQRKQEFVKVGFVGTLTGRLSDLGVVVRNGVELAVEQINKGGGIHGQTIILVIQDDKNDPELIPELYALFQEEEVVAVIGHTYSNISMAALPLINQKEILLIGPTNTSNALTGLDDFFIRVSQPNQKETELQASFILQELELEKVAVIYDSGNRNYCQDWLEHFTIAYTGLGGAVTDVLTFESGSHVHFSKLAEDLLKTEGEAFLIIAGATDTAMICQQLNLKDSTIPRFTSGWAKTSELLQWGGSAVEGLFITHVFDQNYKGESYLEFQQAYWERFHTDATFGAAFGYDALLALKEALLKGSTHTAVELKNTLLEIKDFQGLQGNYSLDAYGDPHRDYFLFQVKNNAFQRVNLNGGHKYSL